MKLRNGVHKGKQVVLHQFANDWLYVDVRHGDKTITTTINPTAVDIEPDDLDKIRQERHTGQFWQLYELSPDNTRFVRIKRKDR